MKFKSLKLLISPIVVLAATAPIISCENSNNDDGNKLTITFQLQSDETVVSGQTSFSFKDNIKWKDVSKPIVEKNGYKANGWTKEDGTTVLKDDDDITGNITVKPLWLQQRNIHLEAAGGKFSDGSAEKNITVDNNTKWKDIVIPQPTWIDSSSNDEHSFSYWIDEQGNKITPDFLVDRDVNAKAKWEDLYEITFDINPGSQEKITGSTTSFANPGILWKEINKPTVELSGFKFKGWSEDGQNVVAEDQLIESSMTVKPLWENRYVVKFYQDETQQEPISSQNVSEGDKASYVNPGEKEGYYFAGWYTSLTPEEIPFDFEVPVTGNVNVYGKWIQKPGNVFIFSFHGTNCKIDGQYSFYKFVEKDSQSVTFNIAHDTDSLFYEKTSLPDGVTFDESEEKLTINNMNQDYDVSIISRSWKDGPVYIEDTGTAKGKHFISDWTESGICATSSATPIKCTDGTQYKRTSGPTFSRLTFVLNPSLTSIPDNFLGHCTFFNTAFTLPDSIESIGNNFLKSCSGFNKPISLPNNITNIGSGFMSGCSSFNSSFTLPNKITKICDDFLYGCSKFNQPISLNNIISIGDNFLGNCSAFDCALSIDHIPSIGNGFLSNCTKFNKSIEICPTITTIGNDFMSGCSYFESQLTLPPKLEAIGNGFLSNTGYEGSLPLDNITSLGDNFLSGCDRFNAPLNLSKVTIIGNSFMYDCSKFNSELTLCDNLIKIGDDFMRECNEFNHVLKLPENTLVSIGNNFMMYCSKFNQPLTLSKSLTSIGTNFLAQCGRFDQDLKMPDGIKSIPEYFLFNCQVFKGSLTLPKELETIGNYFLYSCKVFDKDLIIPGAVTSIGNQFMNSCISFKKDITIPSSVISIGDDFMDGCEGFDKAITLSTNLTHIGKYFLKGCINFNNEIKLPDTLRSIEDYFLGGCTAFNSKITFPENLISIGNNFLATCESFDKEIILPEHLTSIGSRFLDSCENFSKQITLQEEITSIGDYFLSGCKSFNQNITLPNSLTSIGAKFLYNCNSMVCTVYTQQLDASVFAESNQSFATTTETAVCYTQGITISGDHAQDIRDKFPYSETSPYRHLI